MGDLGRFPTVLNGQEKWSIPAQSLEVDPGCGSAAFGLWSARKKLPVVASTSLPRFDWEQLLGVIVGTVEPSDVFVFSRAVCWLRNLSSVSC